MMLAIAAAFAAPAYAAPTNWEYQVTIPAQATNCVAPSFAASLIAQGGDPSFFCFYTETGEFTDKLDFSVSNPTAPITLESIGLSRHIVGQSGRAHPSYTWSTTLTNVVVVDAAGNIVVQLVDTPFQALRACRATNDAGPCSPHLTDDWKAITTLPVGNYSVVVMGTVGGNRVGSYQYSLTVPVAPVQLPLTPLTLNGTAGCDTNSVCTFTPADATAITSVVMDFGTDALTLNPVVAAPMAGQILTQDIVAISDTSIDLAGTGTVVSADGLTTIAVSFSFSFDIASSQFINWVVVTQ